MVMHGRGAALQSARGGDLEPLRDHVAALGLFGDEARRRLRVRDALAGWLGETGGGSPADVAIQADSAADALVGLGPLDAVLADPEVGEVMVSGLLPIRVERAGCIQDTGLAFGSTALLRQVLERLLRGTGRRLDEGHPVVDAALPGGVRIHAVLPPVAVDGPHLTLRRPRAQILGVADLVGSGALDPAATAFLHAAVLGRRSLLVTGAAGTGKTTVLAALASLVSADERIVVLEDTAELRIDHPHLARLECRAALADSGAAVTLRDLVRASLRMRPDRIVVGEVRGEEAADMVQAMSTGHDGSMATLHAGSAVDAVERLVGMLALAWPAQTDLQLRRWIGSAIDLVVHCTRDHDGRRHISEVAALEPDDHGTLGVSSVFVRRPGGALEACGELPVRCLERMEQAGCPVPPTLFARGRVA